MYFLFFKFAKSLISSERRNVSGKKEPRSYQTVRVFRAYLSNQHCTRIIRVFIDRCHVWCNAAANRLIGLQKASLIPCSAKRGQVQARSLLQPACSAQTNSCNNILQQSVYCPTRTPAFLLEPRSKRASRKSKFQRGRIQSRTRSH
jgi:hypothetical protein